MAEGPLPLTVLTTAQFKKDRKRGKDMNRLLEVVDALRNRRPLTARHRDHALAGEWQDWRECHIEPDWLLIDRVIDDPGELILGRAGIPADLFGS